MIPLADRLTNRTIAAGNIAGENDQYREPKDRRLSRSLMYVPQIRRMKNIIKNGLIKGKDYEKLIILQNSHAGYYPGASR